MLLYIPFNQKHISSNQKHTVQWRAAFVFPVRNN